MLWPGKQAETEKANLPTAEKIWKINIKMCAFSTRVGEISK